MRLDRAILFAATITAAATTGTAFAQTDQENPPSAPPQTEVQPAPAVAPAYGTAPAVAPPYTAPPPVEPGPVAVPAPVATYPGQTADVGPMSPHMKWMPTTGFGVGLFVGGGVTDYTGSAARDQTSTGGSWTGRLTLGTRSIVGLEGSYIGGANTIHGFTNNNNATLIRNGIEGAVRINLPLYVNQTLLEPYISGGVGWNDYRVTNYNTAINASVSTGTDSTLSIPLAGGFTFGYHGFLADLRYTIRPTYDQQILINQSSSALTNWDVGGMVGYEF
jgi:hypothetical protein